MAAHLSLRAELTEVAVARQFVANTVRAFDGWDHALDTAVLLVSELVTNAVVHAETNIDVCVSCEGHRLIVEVGDESDRLPVESEAAAGASTGRGIPIVAAMADRWGVQRLPGRGKVVWFTLLGPPPQ